MKLKIQTHRIFEKDAKKMKKRGKDLSKLKIILNILSRYPPNFIFSQATKICSPI